MKKLSKFQIILLTVFGSLGVAGVLIFALAVGRNDNANVGTVVIWGTFDDARMSAVIQAAADADGRLIGVSYVEKDPSVYEAELADAIASGRGPDLFFVRQDTALRNAGKALRLSPSSLSPEQFQSTFLAAADPFLTGEGAIGVPLISDPLLLFWNRPLLGASGLTEPPRFWDEVASMAQVITVQADAGTIKKSGIALGSYSNIADAKDILSTLILQAGGSITTADESGKIVASLAARGGSAAEPSLAALNFYTQFADPASDSYSWNRSLPEAQSAFAQGDVGLYIGFASEAALIKQKNPNLDFGTAAMPQTRTAALPLTVARTYALAVSRSSKNPQGALTVAYILASPSVSQGFASVLGMASSLRSVVAQGGGASQGDTPLDRIVAQSPKSAQALVNSQAAIARTWVDPDPAATNALFRAMIEDTVSGAAKPTDALSRAEKAMKQILDTYEESNTTQ